MPSRRQLVRSIRDKLQVRREVAIAVIDNVERDSANRIIGATATIDGMQGQSVAIDFGAPMSEHDAYIAVNEGSPTAPSWILRRRLQSLRAAPNMDYDAEFPAPAGLDLEAGSRMQDNGSIIPWIYATWLTVGEEFVGVDYELELRATEASPRARIQFVPDDAVESTLRVDINTTDALIPHAKSQVQAIKSTYFPTSGRIKIGSELIKYDVGTDAKQVLSGTGGVGGVNTFTVSTANWTVDEWINFCLIDSLDDEFLITSNTATVLTVVGTPASGSWSIYPAFSQCTRAQGGTDAVAHSDGDVIYRRSMGTMIESLSGGSTYSARVRVTRDASKGAWSNWASIQTSEIRSMELFADPTTPDEGEWVIWMSDGTGSGDDGDIMLKVKAGGATKTITLVDFSAS